ncbi:hypothetical protein RND81_08G002700 [Saponaria officinalis]|uniref:Uncharacterized protein n=1 Tax=Saponaria officinalis TaxID=3572 RepID=A0AAW1J2K4_SAPOF
MVIIKQFFLFIFIIYIISFNFLESIARPIRVLKPNDGQLDVVEITNDPIEILTDEDPFIIPEFGSDPPSSSRRRYPDLSNQYFTFPPATLSTEIMSPHTEPSILFRGEGEMSGNGKDDVWWYEINSNGELHTSSNFFEDQSVPPEVKKQVKHISEFLKHGGHV